MGPRQNPFVALTALEEMAFQLSQQKLSMAPNQPLIQFLSFPSESENEMENATFYNGLQPDHGYILLATRSRFENLQRQRNKGGARKNAGHAFVTYAGGGSGSKRYHSSGSRGRGKTEELVVR